MNTKVEEDSWAVFLVRLVLCTLWAFVLFGLLLDAPRWFIVFAALWFCDKLEKEIK